MSDPQSLATLFCALLEIPRRMAALELNAGKISEKVDRLLAALPPALIPIPEAAAAFKVSIPTMRRWAKRGEVPTVKIGNTIRVDMSRLHGKDAAEVSAWAAEARGGPSSPCRRGLAN
jgi:excisionase family DNA binding protein